MNRIQQFEQWLNGIVKAPISPENDQRLYQLAFRLNVQPAFVIRVIYFLWVMVQPATLLDTAEKR